MRKAILIGKVAGLARQIEQHMIEKSIVGVSKEMFDLDDASKKAEEPDAQSQMLRGLERSSTMNIRIVQLLGEWEEPETTSSITVCFVALLDG